MISFLVRISAMTLVLIAGVRQLLGQSLVEHQAQQNVVLAKLFDPVYPALARQTRITGDVELKVEIRADGSLESVDALGGHPLLKQAALDSAKRSQFECDNCAESILFALQMRITAALRLKRTRTYRRRTNVFRVWFNQGIG